MHTSTLYSASSVRMWAENSSPSICACTREFSSPAKIKWMVTFNKYEFSLAIKRTCFAYTNYNACKNQWSGNYIQKIHFPTTHQQHVQWNNSGAEHHNSPSSHVCRQTQLWSCQWKGLCWWSSKAWNVCIWKKKWQ